MPKLFSVGPNQGDLLLQGFSMKSENNLRKFLVNITNWPLVRYDVGSSEKWGPQIILCESACSSISIIVLR